MQFSNTSRSNNEGPDKPLTFFCGQKNSRLYHKKTDWNNCRNLIWQISYRVKIKYMKTLIEYYSRLSITIKSNGYENIFVTVHKMSHLTPI